jgi:hypothetical protein
LPTPVVGDAPATGVVGAVAVVGVADSGGHRRVRLRSRSLR